MYNKQQFVNIKNHYSQTSRCMKVVFQGRGDTYHKSFLRFNDVPASIPLIDVAGW